MKKKKVSQNLMPTEYQIKLPHNNIGKNVKVEESCELPWDVLDIIAKKLDFDDLFHFAGVCKNWRAFHKIYWRNFSTSQKPLLLQSSSYHGNNQELYTLGSISDQKDYCPNMKSCFIDSTNVIYVSSSGGYFIMVGHDNSFVLINPFTRIKKVINVSTFEVKFQYLVNHALLAFGKSSEEFVLVVICNILASKKSLNVYQSRNCGWVTYSTMENQGRVVNFVVFQYKIYVITDKANLGVLNLNSANIEFLELKNTPRATIYARDCWLVCCDEQLLMVNFIKNTLPDVYKIDFSTMSYVKLETLGDIALFYAACRNCDALSNPNRWGYQSNSVYIVSSSPTPKCTMYSWDDKKLQKDITLPSHASPGAYPSILGWSFRHQRNENMEKLVSSPCQASTQARSTIGKLMNASDGEKKHEKTSLIEEDLKSSNAHCISYKINDLSKARKVDDLRQKLRMRGLRCHPMYCRGSTRMHVIPLLASRAQALRYLFVRWRLNAANMYVILGETGDTDYEEMISGTHKTIIIKGVVSKGSEELLRGPGSYQIDDVVPNESPLVAYISETSEESIANALKQLSISGGN